MPAHAPAAAEAWKAATVSPLLLELARALRARRYYPAEDPAVAAVVDRASAVWAATLARSPTLRLAVSAEGFALISGERIEGSGLESLARNLARTGIQQLEFRAELRAEEIRRFVDVLAAATDPDCPGPAYDAAFEAAGIEHIALGYGAVRSASESAPAPAAAGEPEAEKKEGDRLGACLSDLDRSRDAVEYQRGLEKLRALVDPLILSGDCVDAYLAALMLGRHTASADRSTAIREVACEALQSLVLGDTELTRIALERVYSPNSRAAIEALQLLAALGPRLVPHLLAAHERGGAESRQNTAAILLAMGDAVFPALVDQLEARTPARAILVAELLGEMQNPRALPALSSAMAARRPLLLRLAAARAVARLGGERARVVLESHAQAESEELSRACRTALQNWQGARR